MSQLEIGASDGPNPKRRSGAGTETRRLGATLGTGRLEGSQKNLKGPGRAVRPAQIKNARSKLGTVVVEKKSSRATRLKGDQKRNKLGKRERTTQADGSGPPNERTNRIRINKRGRIGGTQASYLNIHKAPRHEKSTFLRERWGGKRKRGRKTPRHMFATQRHTLKDTTEERQQ